MPAQENTVASSPTLQVDERGIGWVVFDDPDRGHNILTEAVMRRLAEVVREIQSAVEAGRIRAVAFRSGKDRGFVAGADVKAIEAIEDPVEGERAARLGQAIFMEVEDLPVPTVAAVHGICLGGGTELCLACRYRVLSDAPATQVGLPEVQLGILPAWGGTTRLPRLVGLRAALDLLLTGKEISASRAEEIGFADAVVPADLFQEAVADFLERRVDEGPLSTGRDRSLLTRLLEDTPPGRRLVLSTARKRVLGRTGGHYPAPLKILEVLKKSLGRSVAHALEIEAAAAGELIVSTVSKKLVHVFNLREAARKGSGLEADVEARPVKTLGVLGAGVMGGGIAQLAAYNDLRVRMKDIEHDAVSRGLEHARSLFDQAVEKRKTDRREADRKMERISGGVDYAGFGSVDLVVEAVVERMDVKRQVLSEAEERAAEHCVLTTNTSSLSIDEMAEALERPANFGGMHFFNPVHKMPLVEVVRGRRTSDATTATIYALALELGKVPVVVRKDGPGFLVNRILGPYLNEAGWLLHDGARIEDVDAAAEGFGMPMGPLRLVDEVGIDVVRHAGRTLHEAFGARLEPAPPLVVMGESERLGRKGGLGFYRYEDGDAQGVDPDAYRVMSDAVPRERVDVDEREIRARLLLTMMNEAARILDEGITDAAADVDLGMVMGTGFPPFRGGLLRYADDLHPRAVLDRTEEYRESLGIRFRPATLLERLARKDRLFYEEFPS